MVGPFPATTQRLLFTQRVDPVSPEPGNGKHRLRGRLLPLDFRGRLVEGPRDRSSLYIPPLYLKSEPYLPTPAPIVVLDAADIKALGSALRTNQVVIWLPANPAIEE